MPKAMSDLVAARMKTHWRSPLTGKRYGITWAQIRSKDVLFCDSGKLIKVSHAAARCLLEMATPKLPKEMKQ